MPAARDPLSFRRALAQAKAREADLNNLTQRLMTVLNAMEPQIYLADMDTHELVFMNQSAIQAFGQGAGRPCYQVLQGLAAPCPFCTNDQLLNPDGTPAGIHHWEFQNQINHHWYDLQDCALRWPDGRLVRLEVATDITARKEAELRCQDHEYRWRQALDSSGIGVWDWNLITNQVFYSRQWKTMLGYGDQEIGNTLAEWESRVHPEDLPACHHALQRYLSGETPSYRNEHRVLGKDGNYRWVLDRGKVCEWTADGRPARMLGTLTDIQERKLNEAALRAAQERLEAMINALPDLMFRVDGEGHILDCQGSAENKFFVPSIEFLRRKVTEVLPPKAATIIMAAIKEAVSQGWHRGATYALPMPEGLTWFELSIARMGDSAQPDPQFILLARDITSRKRAEAALQDLNATLERRVADRTAALEAEIGERQRQEEALRQARDLADQANAAKSEFLAHMSHEIRTPLYSVLGLAQMIGREPLSAHQRAMVGRIQTAGESLLNILNDILDLAKIEAGYLHLDAQPFALPDLLQRLDDLYGPTVRHKGLGWCLEVPPLPPGLLIGDNLRLEQVLANLIGNAIKFTEQGEIRLRLQVREAREQRLRLRFSVEDTGIGISPTDRQRLFTPFTQLERGHNRRYAGTGLGLPISQRLVEMMGGEIGIDSQPGQGSAFWFELPFNLARFPATEPARMAEASAPRRGQLQGLRVLVVDDSPEHRELMHQALVLDGAQVTEASDGAQVIRYLRENSEDCDLVLMDLQMPVMDGFTATRLIRNELGLIELPIVALTAGVLPDQHQAALAVGFDEILTKPIDLNRIAARLSPWLGGRSQAAGAVKALAAGSHPSWNQSPVPLAAGADGNPQPAVAFPEIAGISRVQAENNLAGDLTRFRKLVEGFIRQFHQAAPEIRTDLEQGRKEEAAARLHRLRGYAGSIGALVLMRQAGLLEDAVRQDETRLNDALTRLGSELANLIAACQTWLDLPLH